jgi:hypothetical protein
VRKGQQQTMVIREVCPRCKSFRYKKNGHIHNGKKNHYCHDCGRQFVQCFEALPDHLHVQPVTCKHNVMIQRLEVETGEMANFVKKKANKQWIWIAMDATSRQVIAFHVGARSNSTTVQRQRPFHVSTFWRRYCTTYHFEVPGGVLQ